MQREGNSRLETAKIERVKTYDDSYEIMYNGCICICLDKKYGVIPKVGDSLMVNIYRTNQIMGIQVNDKIAFNKTEADIEREHKIWCENYHRSEWEEYYKTLAKIKDEPAFETVDISGMSGGYEVACQRMLRAGINYLKDKPDFHFDYEGFERIYGICFTETPWGKDLDKILMEAVNNDCTGAMHQCVIGHLSQIHKHGLEWWLKQFPKERRYKFPTELPKPKCPNPVALNVKDFTRGDKEKV
jgi:hypothetical protein